MTCKRLRYPFSGKRHAVCLNPLLRISLNMSALTLNYLKSSLGRSPQVKNLNLQNFRLVCKTELVWNTGRAYDSSESQFVKLDFQCVKLVVENWMWKTGRSSSFSSAGFWSLYCSSTTNIECWTVFVLLSFFILDISMSILTRKYWTYD